MYFVRNNKEPHFPFTNDEKQWTQALNTAPLPNFREKLSVQLKMANV